MEELEEEAVAHLTLARTVEAVEEVEEPAIVEAAGLNYMPLMQ